MIHIREVYFKLLSITRIIMHFDIWGLCHVLKQEPGQFFFSKSTKEESWNFPKGCLKDKYPLILIMILGTTVRNCPYS